MEVPFTISARTAKLIGLENFANAEGAIVELVKNSYDADADLCAVVLDIKKHREDSKIYIIDNGTGMSTEVIINHWMTIGTDDKLVNAKTRVKRRIKSGAKGIGRFALNRLGKSAEMLTFTEAGNGLGCSWSVNWDLFDKANTLSEIKASLVEDIPNSLDQWLRTNGLEKLPISQIITNGLFHGTILCISDLNDEWNKEAKASLLCNLEMLIPEHMKSAFEIYLYDLSDLSWSGKVNPAEYTDYDYKVSAHYKEGDVIWVKLERNELNVSLLETKYSNVFLRPSMKKHPYRLEDFDGRVVEKQVVISDSIDRSLLSQVGSFDFTFFFIKNTVKDDMDRDGNKKYPYNTFDSIHRKAWLDKFGGVRIFRDEFRVRPYGENGNDWLDLGRRQAKSPGGAGQKLGGYRIRPNQIAGIVNISRLANPAFEDKSSREGIQENDVFYLFKNLLLQVISEFENDRNYIMFNLSEQYRSEHPVTIKAQDIAKNVLSGKKDSNVAHESEEVNLKILAESYQSLEEELHQKDAELAMIRGLASMGISAATYTHELRSIMFRLMPRNDELRRILVSIIPEERFTGMRFDNPYKELDIIKGEDEKLYNWLQYSLHSIQRSKRDLSEINMCDYFQRFVASWNPSLLNKKIWMILNMEGMDDACIDAYEMDLDSVFNNFVSNSINAFMKSSELEKRIVVTVKNDHGYMVVDFEDNGVGLAKEYKNNPDIIFNAFETSTVDNKNNKIGTGMGLFIVKGVVDKFKDSTIAVLPKEKGFCIRTILKLKQK